jgi:hypothetical protein
MKIDPVTVSDLVKVLRNLPKVDSFPTDTIMIPLEDKLTGDARMFTFGKRSFFNSGKEEKYWVMIIQIATKGVR